MASGMVRFLQIEGDSPKVLELAGHAAPHGRPRKEPVAETEKRVRESEVYLPGGNVPVRHIFGKREEPITMKGRFRDSLGGAGFAKAKHDEVTAFVDDARLCEVIWDDLLDVHGLITSYRRGIESPHEFTYEIEVKVDRDLLTNADAPRVPDTKGPKAITDQIIAALAIKDKLPTTPPTLRGSVVDLLNSLVGTVNGATAALVNASNDIDSFVTGTVTALKRLRGGLAQTRVAVQNLRSTYDGLRVTAAIESESANESLIFSDIQSTWAANSLEAMRLIAVADREAAIAEQGRVLALHDAAIDETWESIATRWYGSAARADEIRLANGVPAGTDPVPGTVYLVPR
jgi:hypothetical protein